MVSKVMLSTSAAVILMTAGAAPAYAQASYSFDLPAQPLERSLRAVASQTGSNIVFSQAAVTDRAAPALRGKLSAADAYKSLLRGSGLRLSVTSGGSYVVAPSAGAAGTGGPAAREAQGAGSIAGHVVEADSGRNVQGALVRIVETGQTATADDLGNFRFPSVPAGNYTLEISFLGFETVRAAAQVTSGTQFAAEFAMGEPGGADAEIVVFGSRSARANALNLQRTAENNSEVISADDLGNFTGTTFSEALRRAPGVSFQRDALTGDGTNVIVRGLDPDMNAVKLNGLNLPVGNGQGRSADLSNLLADSVSRITVHKSLLPSQDSAGTGGLVEIETLSPLNRPRRYGNFLIEGGRSGKGFSNDFLASGTVAGRFGDAGNFGLSGSVQYRRNSNRNIRYNTILNYGEYLPLDAAGQPTITSIEQVDPLSIFPFAPDAANAYPARLETLFNHVQQETIAGTLSAEWRVDEHSDLKFDFQHSEANRTTFALGDVFDAAIEYRDRPGGPARLDLGLDLAPGNAALDREQQYGYDRDAKTVSDTYSFNGKTSIGKLEFKYLLGYAHGTETHPANFGTSFRIAPSDAVAGYFLPEATGPDGYIISPFGPRVGSGIPMPLLTGAGWAFVNDPSNFVIENASGQIDTTTGRNDRYTASYSAKYALGWRFIDYIEAGGYFERAEFKSDLIRSQFGGGIPVSALGFEFEPSDLTRIGLRGSGFSVVGEASLRDFVDNIDDYAGGSTGFTLTPIVPNPDQDNQQTVEQNLAAYLQARLQFGKLEIIGGARYNRLELEARNLIFPSYIGPILPANGGGFGNDLIFQNDFARLVTEKGTTEDILPRILFNYRESDKLIFRGGYFLSVARPQIAQLSTLTRISFINIPIPGPEGLKPILQINTGNPDLKPATTHNFDLSAEYYDGNIGVIKLSGFYKRINNLLQANQTNGPANLAAVTLPAHPYFQGAPYFDPADPSSVFIIGTTPANSDYLATIWGVEAQVERQFTFLPGAWNGFGIYANVIYTKSSRAERYSWEYGPADDNIYEFFDVPFNQQPKYSGTAALTYNKHGIDATLAYGFQSRALSQFRPRGLGVYSEGVRTLDFRAEYYLKPSFGRVRIYAEASDLLKGTGRPDVEETFGGVGPTPKFYTRATYLGGRRFKLGVSTTF